MLKGAFRPVPLGGEGETFMPYVRVSVINGGRVSHEVDGLLDSGAAANIISVSSAKALLGMPPEEIRKGRPLSIAGLGGVPFIAYGWQVDFRLRATTSSTDYFLWQGVWIYACDMELPSGQILIGQRTGLEEKVFVHINRGQKSKPTSAWKIFYLR